ncbi:RnfABCDGE type electron transport complex subunit D [Treponema parvum]|uniref:Ion-translocating oxidoreductase complex subunit D n=1 Tax=Treponema parvum TaxID=138851 RepID=A0A975F0P3_9SPIR|nr:RnfABCDGE type electron transport complex subunit D [Treponema parvum]QTQ12306.1 RnfABCDGE type electron transport complex subunit D [Treponema parvum]
MADLSLTQLKVSSSPHISEGLDAQTLMCLVLTALLPLSVYGVILYGVNALVRLLLSVALAVAFEALFQLATKQKVTVKDCSAAVTGLLFALTLPPMVPLWQLAIGILFSIVVAKGFFGGLGANVYNPALAGRAFLFVSFPSSMGAVWVNPATDAVSSATVLSQIKSGDFTAGTEDYLNFFLGKRAGCIGETGIFLIIIAFVFLWATKVIDWRATIAMLVTASLAAFLSGGDVLMTLLSGGLLFGAVFMATDYATTPQTKPGRLVFGAACGFITFLIRKFGGYPEGVMFSILIMNSLTAFLNNLTGRKYGYKRIKKAEAKK